MAKVTVFHAKEDMLVMVVNHGYHIHLSVLVVLYVILVQYPLIHLILLLMMKQFVLDSILILILVSASQDQNVTEKMKINVMLEHLRI